MFICFVLAFWGSESCGTGEKIREDILKNVLEKVKEYQQREMLRLLQDNTRTV